MKKLKDLVYDYNDILIAILIIIIAGIVIFVKVSDIMAYPSFARNEVKQSEDVDFSDVNLDPIDVDPVVNPGTDVIQGNPEDEDPLPVVEPEPQPNQGPIGDVKFEVKQGDYLSTVATHLKEKGLIDDKAAFISKVEEMKLDSKIKPDIYTITAGSTYEEIAKIITKTK